MSDEVLRAFAVGRIFILETLSTASFGSKVAVTNVAIGSMDRQRVDFYLDLRFPYDFAAYSIDEDCSLPVGHLRLSLISWKLGTLVGHDGFQAGLHRHGAELRKMG